MITVNNAIIHKRVLEPIVIKGANVKKLTIFSFIKYSILFMYR